MLYITGARKGGSVMTTYTKWLIGIIVLMLALSGIVIWTIQYRFFEQQSLSAQQVTQKVVSLYGGKVELLGEHDDQFILELERNGALYDVQVSAETGDVSKLKLLKAAEEEVVVEPNPTSEPNSDEQDNNRPQTLISLGRAINIALEELKGEVEDATFEASSDGGYYLIEIDGDDVEAVFQIHAITGSILSVTYD